MNVVQELPSEARLAIAFVVGVCAGAVVNWAAYALAYQPRWISPWSRAPRGEDGQPLSERSWRDRLPLLGWWFLRRESAWHGGGFWLRPMIVELALGCVCCWLFWWEVERWELVGRMMPARDLAELRRFPSGMVMFSPAAGLLAAWWAHAVLLACMVAASLIDIDERTIPDAVTVPGTLVGLTLMAVLAAARLPADVSLSWACAGSPVVIELDGLTAVSPATTWPDVLASAPRVEGLLVALVCYSAWVFLLLPRPWYMRHGVRRAMVICAARAWRGFTWHCGRWRPMLLLCFGGWGAVVGVWWVGGEPWIGLVSSLLGMTVGGGLVWIVRQIGTRSLGMEAMGLGDVTLLAMIGSFLGWQVCLVAFFVAPLFGVVHGVIQLAIRRSNDLFYGPYLCLGTATVVVFWGDVWGRMAPVLEFGWLLPAVLGVGFALMGLLLAVYARLWPRQRSV